MCLLKIPISVPAANVLQNLATPVGTTPMSLHLGTIIRRVLSHTLHPFYRRERKHHYPINRRMASPKKRPGESAGDIRLKVVRLLCVLSISGIGVCSV